MGNRQPDLLSWVMVGAVGVCPIIAFAIGLVIKRTLARKSWKRLLENSIRSGREAATDFRPAPGCLRRHLPSIDLAAVNRRRAEPIIEGNAECEPVDSVQVGLQGDPRVVQKLPGGGAL